MRKVFYISLCMLFVSITLLTTIVSANPAVDPISAAGDEKVSEFGSFDGTVVTVEDRVNKENEKYLLLEDSNGGRIAFVVSDNTYVFNGTELKTGQKLIVFYEFNTVNLLIYPPQYKVLVIAQKINGKGVYVGRFDKDYLSVDNSLKLIGMDKAVVLSRNGEKFVGDIINKRVAVMYGPTTRSLPPQTNPEKVIVLEESAGAVPESGGEIKELSCRAVIVNGKVIDASLVFANENNMVMVPLRAIAEVLGYTVTWDGESKKVTLSDGITLQVGKDYYIYEKSAQIELGNAPKIVNGRTYVPLDFFRKVIKMNNAYFFEGQIVIDNNDKME